MPIYRAGEPAAAAWGTTGPGHLMVFLIRESKYPFTSGKLGWGTKAVEIISLAHSQSSLPLLE